MRRLAVFVALFALGGAAGFLGHSWWLSLPAGPSASGPEKHSRLDQDESRSAASYVCPMHPQIVRDTPGTCPICGMDLVAKAADLGEVGAPGHAHDHREAIYVCPMHPEVAAGQPGRCPHCGMTLVPRTIEGEVANGPAQTTASVALSSGIVNQLGVRTAKAYRGRLERRLDAFGAYFEVTAQGFRGNVQSTEPGAKNLVLAQVFEGEAPLVRVGQAAEIRFTGLGTRAWKGTVESVDPQVNQGTHTLQFRVAVEMEGAAIKPGTSARVRLAVDPIEDVLLVPREAVIATARADRVVVALGGGRSSRGRWWPRTWVRRRSMIRSGLAEGERGGVGPVPARLGGEPAGGAAGASVSARDETGAGTSGEPRR